jgi:hypothetical protein
MSAARTLGDLGAYVRSKNAGPFWLTIDVICSTPEDYAQVVGSALTDPATIADIYDADPQAVRIFSIESLHTVKITLPRPAVQGSVEDRDAHAGQQFVPLLETLIE